MVVITPGPQLTTRDKEIFHQECGTTIYLCSEDEELFDTQDIPLVITYNGVHHFAPREIISHEALKEWLYINYSKASFGVIYSLLMYCTQEEKLNLISQDISSN